MVTGADEECEELPWVEELKPWLELELELELRLELGLIVLVNVVTVADEYDELPGEVLEP